MISWCWVASKLEIESCRSVCVLCLVLICKGVVTCWRHLRLFLCRRRFVSGFRNREKPAMFGRRRAKNANPHSVVHAKGGTLAAPNTLRPRGSDRAEGLQPGTSLQAKGQWKRRAKGSAPATPDAQPSSLPASQAARNPTSDRRTGEPPVSASASSPLARDTSAPGARPWSPPVVSGLS